MVEVAENDEKSSEKDSDKSSEKDSDKSSEKILQLLAKTPTLSAKQLAQQLGLSSRAIEKNIAQLKADGLLKRVGAAKGGYWEVVVIKDN